MPDTGTLPGGATLPFLGWRGNVLRYLADPIGYIDRLPTQEGVILFAEGGCPPIMLTGEPGGWSVFAIGADVPAS